MYLRNKNIRIRNVERSPLLEFKKIVASVKNRAKNKAMKNKIIAPGLPGFT